jgi:hypothetical protein
MGGDQRMKQKDEYELLRREYLSKCRACDECIAEHFCISNHLRKAREPHEGCEEKLKLYLRERKVR